MNFIEFCKQINFFFYYCLMNLIKFQSVWYKFLIKVIVFFFFFSIYICAFEHDILSTAIWITQAFKHTLQKLYPASLTQFINQAVLSNVFFRCQQWLTVCKLSHASSLTLIEPYLTHNDKQILCLHSLQFNHKWLRYKLHPNQYCILSILCHTVHNWQAIAPDLHCSHDHLAWHCLNVTDSCLPLCSTALLMPTIFPQSKKSSGNTVWMWHYCTPQCSMPTA